MTVPVRPDQLAEQMARLRRGQSDDPLAAQMARIAAARAAQPPFQAEATRQMPGTMPRDPRSARDIGASLAANAVDALTFGGLDELAAATGAIGGLFSGEGFRAGAESGFRGMKLLREGGAEHDPVTTRLARGAGIAGSIIPALAAAGPAAAPSLLRSMGTAGGIGAGMGLLSDGGAGERVRNAAVMGGITAALPPLAAGGFAVAGALPGVPAALRRVFGGAVGRRGEASDVVAQRMQMDRASGLTAPPIAHPSVPSLAIDEAGPAVQGLARGVLRSPGEGRAILGNALERRSEQMRPAITAELERRTGMSGQRAREVLVEIADEQSALARVFEAEAALQSRGITALKEVVDETTARMQDVYDRAREATRGFAVESPTFSRIIETPIGKQAWEFAQISKANAGSALPTVERALPVGGLSAEQLAAVNARNVSRGLPEIRVPTETVPVPDPESIHLMKRFFANVARLGQQDGAQGLQAARAQGALRQWDNIRGEILDPAWVAADDAASQMFNIRRAAKLGLDGAKATTNPGSRRAATMSIQSIQDRVAAMSPEERGVFDPIFRFAVGNRIQQNSVAATRRALANPNSDLSQLVEMATGRKATPELRAAERGLSVLSTPAEASGAAAGRTLPVLARDVEAMSPAEHYSFRQAAAANLRQGFEGVPSSQRSPGLFFANSPERVEQVGFPFAPGEAAAFQGAVRAWDDVAALKNRLMGGSDTAANLAEQGVRASELERVVADFSTMGTGFATRRTLGRMGVKAADQARREVDEEVAKILAKKGGSLSDAEADAATRAILARVRRRLGIGAGMLASDQTMQGLLGRP